MGKVPSTQSVYSHFRRFPRVETPLLACVCLLKCLLNVLTGGKRAPTGKSSPQNPFCPTETRHRKMSKSCKMNFWRTSPGDLSRSLLENLSRNLLENLSRSLLGNLSRSLLENLSGSLLENLSRRFSEKLLEDLSRILVQEFPEPLPAPSQRWVHKPARVRWLRISAPADLQAIENAKKIAGGASGALEFSKILAPDKALPDGRFNPVTNPT